MNKKVLFILAFFAFGLSADPNKDILYKIRNLGRSVEQILSVETVGNNYYVIVKFDINETGNQNVIYISKDNGQNFAEKTIDIAQASNSFDQIAMCNDVLYVTQRNLSPYEFKIFAWYRFKHNFIQIKHTDIGWRDCARERDLVVDEINL